MPLFGGSKQPAQRAPKIIVIAGPHRLDTSYDINGVNRAVSFLQSLVGRKEIPRQEPSRGEEKQ